MNKEIIKNTQAVSILILFLLGTTLLVGTGGEAKGDMWLSILLSIALSIPLVLIYSRLLSLFRGQGLFDILELVLGKIVGKLVALLFTWYALHLGAMVLRNFGEFLNVVAMPETPVFVPMLCLGALCILVVREGVEVLGRTAAFFLPLVVIFIIIITLVSIPKMHPDYIRPLLYNGFSPIITGAFSALSFPFAETVLFLAVFFSLQPSKSPYKVYLSGIITGGLIITFVALRNLLILSPAVTSVLYFPSHAAVSRLTIGDFLQRMEVTVATTFVVTGFIKGSVCLFAACSGVAKILGLKNYRTVAIQVGLLMIYLASFIYDSIMEMEFWAFKIYAYYAFPFQVILPIIILIAAEIRVRWG
ncbi:MAG TPA: endospore germination permease, partial [Bacillota bacterium]|nr:endospore germination permease [Bacillota bacterium]